MDQVAEAQVLSSFLDIFQIAMIAAGQHQGDVPAPLFQQLDRVQQIDVIFVRPELRRIEQEIILDAVFRPHILPRRRIDPAFGNVDGFLRGGKGQHPDIFRHHAIEVAKLLLWLLRTLPLPGRSARAVRQHGFANFPLAIGADLGKPGRYPMLEIEDIEHIGTPI